MNVSITGLATIVGLLVVGFILGAIITYLLSHMVLSHYRKRINYLSTACDTWVFACRQVLADSWFNKVCNVVQNIMKEGEKK